MSNHLDICMQCGHTRSEHSSDGCEVYIKYPDKYYNTQKCGCVLDNKQGKEVKL